MKISGKELKFSMEKVNKLFRKGKFNKFYKKLYFLKLARKRINTSYEYGKNYNNIIFKESFHKKLSLKGYKFFKGNKYRRFNRFRYGKKFRSKTKLMKKYIKYLKFNKLIKFYSLFKYIPSLIGFSKNPVPRFEYKF